MLNLLVIIKTSNIKSKILTLGKKRQKKVILMMTKNRPNSIATLLVL